MIGPGPGGGGPWRDWSGNQDAAKAILNDRERRTSRKGEWEKSLFDHFLTAKWRNKAIIIYGLLSFLGAVINSINELIEIDTDLFEMAAIILTTTQGFFIGIIYFDGVLFGYRGFYLIPFLLGGAIWYITGIVLEIVFKKGELNQKILLLSSNIVICLGIFIAILGFLYSYTDKFPTLFIYLGTLWLPLIMLGLFIKIRLLKFKGN